MVELNANTNEEIEFEDIDGNTVTLTITEGLFSRVEVSNAETTFVHNASDMVNKGREMGYVQGINAGLGISKLIFDDTLKTSEDVGAYREKLIDEYRRVLLT